MIGIYEIRNLVNDKVYIGQSIDIEKRLEAHKKRESNLHLAAAFKKYGIENFSFQVLKECNKEDLSFYEHFFIIANCSFDSRYGYNKTLGGEEYSVFNQETLNKISSAVKESLEKSEKVKDYHKRQIGMKHSKETRAKQSESAKKSWKNGRNILNYHGGFTPENYEERRKKCALNSKGKIIMNDGIKQIQAKPEDVELYLSQGFKKGCLPVSEETRKKMSESAKKRCSGRDMSTTTGKKIMNKDGVDKYFSKSEIDAKLLEGWKLGRSSSNV